MNKLLRALLIILIFTTQITYANELINQAKAYIADNNYQQAFELLSGMINTNSDDIEEVILLIKTIEKRKINIIETSTKVMNLFLKAEFIEADKLSQKLDLTGTYDPDTNFIIERTRSLQKTISNRVGFVNYLEKIENNIIDYQFKEAIANIKEAVVIYEDIINPDLISIFNELIISLESSGLFENLNFSINFTSDLNIQFELLSKKHSNALLQEISAEKVRDLFAKEINEAKDPSIRLALSAYKAASDRLKEIAIRTTQRNYRFFLTELFSYAEDNIVRNDQSLLEVLNSLNNFLKNNQPELLAFYKNCVDFNDPRLFKRSKLNIHEYLSYLSKKDRLYYKYNERLLMDNANSLDAIFVNHKKNITEGELVLAGSTLKQLTDGNNKLQRLKNQFEDTITQAFFETPLNKSDKTLYTALSERINNINKQIYDESALLENTRITIGNLLNSADTQFKQAENEQKRGILDKAIEVYGKSKDDYVQITTLTKSREIEQKINLINQRIKEIESDIFQRDIGLAEKYVQDARKFLYSDDYVNANNEIKKAQELYQRHNQRSEFADNLQQRVETAIKLRREIILNYDDAAYKNIIEWFENALKSIEKGDYQRAEIFKDKILSEKPFYEKARQLEIKILLARGDMEFFRSKFNGYFTEAMNYYNEGNYTRALNGFSQLLEYNYELPKLKQLIYNCNLRLGLIARPVQTVDKTKANSLVEQARRLYEAADFERALSLVNQAIAVWEDVPGASPIRVGSLRRLHKPLPTMSAVNERKYALATRAYSEQDYAKVIQLTNEILESEKSEKAIQLNSNAKKLQIIRERGL